MLMRLWSLHYYAVLLHDDQRRRRGGVECTWQEGTSEESLACELVEVAVSSYRVAAGVVPPSYYHDDAAGEACRLYSLEHWAIPLLLLLLLAVKTDDATSYDHLRLVVGPPFHVQRRLVIVIANDDAS